MEEQRCNIFIGCSGWSYQQWRGCFYPEDTKSYQMLDFYLKHFNSVEVNSTFYRYAKVTTVKNWANKMDDNFRFTIEVNRIIIHKKMFAEIKSNWEAFWFTLDPLAENKKLGAVLIQFPAIFSISIDDLRNLLSLLPTKDFDFSFEFRHPSWYCQEIYSLLKEHNCDFVSISWPEGEPYNEVLCQHKYFRFHGAKKMIHYDYSYEELKQWADIIQEAAQRANRIYIYFNNSPQCNAPKNAKSLQEILEKRGFLKPFKAGA